LSADNPPGLVIENGSQNRRRIPLSSAKTAWQEAKLPDFGFKLSPETIRENTIE